MGWIILAIVAVIVALEVLVGVLRGVKFSGIRFAYVVLGTVVAALLAKTITIAIVTQIAAASGLQGENLTEIVSNMFIDSEYASIGRAAAPHIAGLSLSILIPLVFVPVFLVLKLVGLILYLITKAIIKGTTKKATEGEEKPATPAYSRVLGGLVGAIIGLLTCALITMPMFNMVTTINNSGMKDTVFGLLEKAADNNQLAMEKNDLLVAVAEAIVYGDAIPVYAADSADEATIAGVKISIIKNLFESTANSPAIAVLKYTGVEAVSNAIINASSTVKPEDIGAENIKTESYNLTESLAEILEVIEPVSELVAVMVSEGSVGLDDLGKVNDFAAKLQEAGFLDEQDKLEILNACKEVVTETIYNELGIDPSTAEVSDYTSIDEFTKDVAAIVEMGQIMASVSGGNGTGDSGQTSSGSITDIDVEALLKDPEKLKSVMSATLNLSNGTEIVATLINNNVEKYTNGKYKNVVTTETLNTVGKDNLIELTDSLLKFTKYDENTVMTEELKQEINEAIDEIVAKGLLTSDVAEEIRQEFGLK